MEKKTLNDDLKKMDEFIKKVENNRELGLKLLVGAGIMTRDGKLRKGYEDLPLAIELGKNVILYCYHVQHKDRFNLRISWL